MPTHDVRKKLRMVLSLVAIGGGLGIALSFAAHGSAAVLAAAGGVGAFISLAMGIAFGATRATSFGCAAFGGFLSGSGSALVGIAAAVLLGDQTLAVLGGGTAGGALSGIVGSCLSFAVASRVRRSRLAGALR